VTRTASAGLLMVAGFILLLAVASLYLIKLDAAGRLGLAIGAGLGVLNLAVGGWITLRALRRGMRSAMATLLGGFFARLVAVAGLVILFQRTDGVDAIAFALSFMIFFFAYLGVEVLLVERRTNGGGRPA